MASLEPARMSDPEHTLSYRETGTTSERSFAAPYICLGMECARPLAPAARYSIAEVDEAVIGRGPARSARRYSESARATLRVEVADTWMSGVHARLSKTDGGWMAHDAGSKNGTFVNGAPIESALLGDGDLLEIGSSIFLFRDRVHRRFLEPADVEVDQATYSPPAFATLSIPLARDFERLTRVARSNLAIVLGGDTGTGKEVVARTIHELSSRSGAFTAVNCGALPESLVESELFGCRKGAFSGATEDRQGLVRAAHAGTLFLDEVAELPEASQAKLLRVLQEHEVLPLGETDPVAVDIRVIAATYQDLESLVESGRFRRDLFARLSGYQTELPPLRERREDIGLLTATMLRRIADDRAGELHLHRSAARALFAHDWPLNIRELEQALGTAIALADRSSISLEHLPPAVRAAADNLGRRTHEPHEDDSLREELRALLVRHGGNVSAVARELGKARVQIRRWCKRCDLDPADFRTGQSATRRD